MRRKLLALFCAALLLGLAACQEPTVEEEPEPSETPEEFIPAPYVEPDQFTLGYSAAGSLHPMKAAEQGSLDVDTLVYEGLFRLDRAFEPQPALAESARQGADGLSWTVKVREGVFFSDGTTLTAQHVVSSLQAARQSARFSARLSGITGVWASGEDEVTITLSAPNGALTALLDTPVFLEREEGLPLGTGPYAFSESEEGVSLRFNPTWWEGAEPPFPIIALESYSSLEERVNEFGSGKVAAVTCDFNASGALGYSGTFETHDYASPVMLYLGFNAAWGRPCAEANMRAALSRVVDREELVVTLMAGHGAAAALPASPDSALYDAGSVAAGKLSYDPEQAAALLEEAGWAKNEDGVLVQRRKKLELTVCVNRDSTLKRSVADRLAGTLEELGAVVTVEVLEWEAYTAALAAGRFDIYIGEIRLTPDFDFSVLTAGALNYGGFWSETLSAAMDEWKGATGTARVFAARKLYDAFAEEAPFAVLCFKNNSLLARWGMVQNLDPIPEAPFAGIENWLAES